MEIQWSQEPMLYMNNDGYNVIKLTIVLLLAHMECRNGRIQ